MKAVDNQFTYANVVLNRGAYNGVINVALGAYAFSPKDDGTVDNDVLLTCRLRMDMQCAFQLHDALGQLLQMIADEQAKAKESAPIAGEEAPKEVAKPN